MDKREKWIDVVKAIGIILMVIGHASPPFGLKVWIYSFRATFMSIVIIMVCRRVVNTKSEGHLCSFTNW